MGDTFPSSPTPTPPLMPPPTTPGAPPTHAGPPPAAPGPAIAAPITTPLPATAPPGKRGWPGSAKLTAIVLAVTTLGAAATGVVLSSSAKSETDEVEAQLATTEADLAKVRKDLETAESGLADTQRDLADVTKERDQAQSDLASVRSDLDAARADADALRSLFPLDVDRFAEVPLTGSYTLTVVDGTAECSGYADDAAACAPSSFPSDLVIGEAPVGGYTASSGFFGVTRLSRDGAVYRTGGTVFDSASDLCNGQSVRTTFEISISVAGVALDAGNALDPTRLAVHLDIAAPASDCTATVRAVDLVGVPA